MRGKPPRPPQDEFCGPPNNIPKRGDSLRWSVHYGRCPIASPMKAWIRGVIPTAERLYLVVPAEWSTPLFQLESDRNSKMITQKVKLVGHGLIRKEFKGLYRHRRLGPLGAGGCRGDWWWWWWLPNIDTVIPCHIFSR